MNPRIRELAKSVQCERHWTEEDIEKFAELMVRECAGVELYWLSEQDRKAVAEKIQEHFGVEE